MKKTDPNKTKSLALEKLTALYLRLNGYFITSFIAHSPAHGKILAEIDLMAVRFPFSSEPEREVMASEFLEPSEIIDLLLCEVKSKGQKLHFNEAFRGNANVIACTLRRAGLFPDNQIYDLAWKLQSALQPTDPPTSKFIEIAASKYMRIRAVISSPERLKIRNNQPRFISGEEIFGYLRRCFQPQELRRQCSTTYDFQSWGQDYEDIVRFFKNGASDGGKSVTDLYSWLDSTPKNVKEKAEKSIK